VTASAHNPVTGCGGESVALVCHGSQALVEDDRVETCVKRGQPGLAVAVEAERRILQACIEDIGIALGNRLGVRRVAVRHRQEARLERAVLARQREVALMRLHGGHQHALGKAQVLWPDVTDDGARVLHQKQHLFELAARVPPRAADPGGRGVELTGDLLAPFDVVRDDGDGAQRVAVRVGCRDFGGAAEESVTAADICGPQTVHIKPHRVGTKLRDDPADGAREAQTRPVAPAHVLGKADPVDHAPRDLRDKLGSRRRRFGDLRKHEAPAPVLAQHQFVRGDALGAGKAAGRGRRCAVLVEGRLLGRPAHLTDAARPLFGKAPNQHRDPARADQHLDRGVGEALRGECIGDEPGNLGDGFPARRRRQFLAPDLDQHVRHQQPP
jgi:hypothetical protein